MVVLIGFGVLTLEFSFLAKDFQYMVSTGEACRGSVWILLEARVGVRRVRRAVFAWWLVWTTVRTVVTVAEVSVVVGIEGLFVLFWPRHMA